MLVVGVGLPCLECEKARIEEGPPAGYYTLTVGMVGGMAYYSCDEIEQCAELQLYIKLEQIMRKPVEYTWLN